MSSIVTWVAYLPLIAYMLFGCYFWQQQRCQNLAISPRTQHIESLGLLTILLLHGYTIFTHIFLLPNLHFGTSEALSVIAWVALLSYWFASFFIQLYGLEPILFFISFLLMALHLALPNSPPLAIDTTPLFKIHFILAMLAYGLMLYATWLALLIRLSEKELHIIKGKALLHRLPPLLSLEQHLFSSMTVGFILLTLALVTGFSFPLYTHTHAFSLSHKTFFSLLSWLIFAVLLWGRFYHGWRGKVAVNWVIIGFIFMILGYIGSAFVLHILLGRPDSP